MSATKRISKTTTTPMPQLPMPCWAVLIEQYTEAGELRTVSGMLIIFN